jgi:hypothetical protein
MEYALIELDFMKIIVTGSRELMTIVDGKLNHFIEYVEACEKDVAKKKEKSSI